MRVTMISIGNELLDGRTADINSSTVGARLAARGLRLDRTEVVADDIDQIVDAIERSGDLVVLSGGLGPTIDDMTREAVARWAGRDLVENTEALNAIKVWFEKRGLHFSEERQRKQATFPEGATVIPNPHGTAPAFRLSAKEKVVFSFPGVPREFGPLSSEIESEFGDDAAHVGRWTFYGTGESTLEAAFGELEDHDVVIGYRARFPYVELKLTAKDANALDRARSYVFENVPSQCVYVDATTSFEAQLGDLLRAKSATITTAESCTAGGIAAAITDVPGSSAWFNCGFVTYSNDAKQRLVRVRADTLQSFGAVSSQVVAQMALGAQHAATAELAVAVSGIAGPGGGTEEKPVGTVYFALATADGVFVERKNFTYGDRRRIREATVTAAVVMATKYLTGWFDDRTGAVRGPFSAEDVMTMNGVS